MTELDFFGFNFWSFLSMCAQPDIRPLLFRFLNIFDVNELDLFMCEIETTYGSPSDIFRFFYFLYLKYRRELRGS